jgi:hypothetical protein
MQDRENLDFGRLAVALKFMTREDLQKALRLQEDLRRVGVRRRLGEILLERKILTREQVLLVLRAQGKTILTCHACRKSYNVHHYRADDTYTCKHCGRELSSPTAPVDTRVHDTIHMSTAVFRKDRATPTPVRKTPAAGARARAGRVPDDLRTLLPGYEILECLGKGGMGTVYKARDTIMNRWVAVKILAPFLAADQEYINRFFVEARNLQKLHHPNIVTAYDAGVAGDHKFFIMEFVDGLSLERVLHRKGTLPERTALEIALRVADALDYAWQRRIIHRDVKPQNIMITKARTVKLCDLGLSKDVTSDLTLTLTGSVNCSPPYASPEQAQGLKGLDCRTDVYSLGVTLFQMLCGELPFKGPSPGQFLIQHVTEAPPNPLSRNPRLSPPTGKLVLRMLQKSPDDRPTPGELVRALRKLLNGQA